MPDGEEPVVEPTLESLHANVKAQSTLLRELATAMAQLTARERLVDGEGHMVPVPGSASRDSRQAAGEPQSAPTCYLELAQSGRVGAKSASDEDDYLAEEYLWMSCFGANMAALFVALDELLPYVPAANQDFTPYLARARNHAEAIDKAFRFRLAFLRRLNEVKRVHAAGADVDEDVAVDAGVAAKLVRNDQASRVYVTRVHRYEREARGAALLPELARKPYWGYCQTPSSNYRPAAGN
eukprot:jgi/Tetstr1/454787/TSEL_041667.t1